MVSSSPAFLHVSTVAHPGRESVEAWRDLFGHAICGLDIEPLSDRPFVSKAVVRVLPGLGVAQGMSSGAHYWRPSHRINSDDLVFVVNHSGHDLARMERREQTLSPGQAVLFAADRVGGTTNAGTSRFTTLRIPRPVVPGADDSILRIVAPDNEALRLLGAYLGVLGDAAALAAPETQKRIVGHVHDLIAMAVEVPGKGPPAEERGGVAAARLRAIKRDIATNAADMELDVGQIAARHRVTPRYVQMLFAQTGTHFSEYLRMCRLAAAHHMLRAPAHRRKSIGEIALDVGFGNISYFNRAFRLAFNASPSDVRAGVRTEP